MVAPRISHDSDSRYAETHRFDTAASGAYPTFTERLWAPGGERLAAMEPEGNLLTQREKDVLILVARGQTNREIADTLCMSLSAVKVFLHQACVKLEARNRAQAVIVAMQQRAICANDVYSLEELADLLASLGPEAIETVAGLLRRKLKDARPLTGVD